MPIIYPRIYSPDRAYTKHPVLFCLSLASLSYAAFAPPISLASCFSSYFLLPRKPCYPPRLHTHIHTLTHIYIYDPPRSFLPPLTLSLVCVLAL